MQEEFYDVIVNSTGVERRTVAICDTREDGEACFEKALKEERRFSFVQLVRVIYWGDGSSEEIILRTEMIR